jgi:SAM-dependent methyltransferase
MPDASAAQYFQSRFTFDAGRAAVWKVIGGYLQRWIPPDGRVLDLGAGYCSLINHVQAREKHALDVYPEFGQFALPEVQTRVGGCDDLSPYATGYFDVVFASNLLEHLSREVLTRTLAEVRRVVKPGGRLILIQPNFRYCYREYFDDYTHMQVFTHVGLADLLSASGFAVEQMEPRFLPVSFKSRLPKWPWLTRLYLKLPWRPLAGQMLVVGRRLA